MHASLPMWRLEDSLQDSILSYYAGPGNLNQVIRLGCKRLYLLSYLAGPMFIIDLLSYHLLQFEFYSEFVFIAHMLILRHLHTCVPI